MTALELLAQLRAAGVQLEADGDRLRVAAPQHVLTDALRVAIAAHKTDLLRYLTPERAEPLELRPGARAARAALSPGQERLWAMVSHAPDSRRYNLPLAFRLRGPLDEHALRGAVATVVERHDVLRTVILRDASETRAEFRASIDASVLRVEPGPDRADAPWISRRVAAEASQRFDVSTGPLIRIVLVPLAADDHLLMITMHHIIADGWSFEVLLDELGAAYDALRAGQTVQLPPLRLQYADVAAWQQRRLTPERRHKAAQFWSDHFADTPSPLGIRRPRPHASDHRVTSRIPGHRIDQCDALGSAEGTTAFAVCLAAYAAYLSAVTTSRDAILCTPAIGREREELQGVIGYINNVLPLRIRVDDTATFRDLVRTVRQLLLRALEWQDLPFQDIAALPGTQRIPLTRGMFSYSGRAVRSLQLTGVAVEAIPVPDRSVDFDLGLSIEAGDATLSFREGVLGEIDAAAFLTGYITFLGEAVFHPDVSLTELRQRSDLPMLERGVVRDQEASGAAPAPDAADPNQMVVGLTRDPLELQLAVIWERLFDVHPIAPDANFFALGGHSLLAVELLNTIEREMGTRLTLSVLAEHPTISALARALISRGWSPEPGSLIRMRMGADGVPFVLLHSFEGHLFLFNELANQIGVHHPVFGCQAVGIDGRARPLRAVQQMAEHYLSQVDEQLGDGPIVLAAMCFGVSVGLEMARRRSSEGKPTHLMLIDSAWEHVLTPQSPGPRRSVLTRVWARALHETTRGRSWLQETMRMVTGSPYARREARIRRRTAKAWLDYTPRPFDGRITLLRTRSTAPGDSDWKLESLQALAIGDYATVYVPGEHFTVLRAPHVTALADAMIAAVSRPVVAR